MQIDYSDPFEIWTSLGLLNKLFGLFLLGVIVKTVYSSALILFNLYALKRRETQGAPRSEESSIRDLSARTATLRQLHMFTLYIAGFCLASGAFGAYHSIDLSKASVEDQILLNWQPVIVYGAFVFLTLFSLHSLQWAVSAGLNVAARRLKSHLESGS